MAQMMLEEQEARQRFERSQRDDTEARWEGMKRLTDEELSTIREQQKVRTLLFPGRGMNSKC